MMIIPSPIKVKNIQFLSPFLTVKVTNIASLSVNTQVHMNLSKEDVIFVRKHGAADNTQRVDTRERRETQVLQLQKFDYNDGSVHPCAPTMELRWRSRQILGEGLSENANALQC